MINSFHGSTTLCHIAAAFGPMQQDNNPCLSWLLHSLAVVMGSGQMPARTIETDAFNLSHIYNGRKKPPVDDQK